MAQALRRVACALGVRGEPLYLFGAGRAHDVQLDGHLIEVRRRVVDVVLLSVAKRCPHIGGRVVDLHFVEWREPRHLGEQSKSCPHHQELER